MSVRFAMYKKGWGDNLSNHQAAIDSIVNYYRGIGINLRADPPSNMTVHGHINGFGDALEILFYDGTETFNKPAAGVTFGKNIPTPIEDQTIKSNLGAVSTNLDLYTAHTTQNGATVQVS